MSTTPTVVYVGPPVGLAAARAVLEGVASVVAVDTDPDALAAALPQADAYLDASTWLPLTDSLLAAAPRLRVVSCASTGSAHIDHAAAARRGVEVRTLRDDEELMGGLPPTAELTWALVLACARPVRAAAAHVEAGHWERERFPGVMLHGRRLGLVGCGRIARWVAGYGRAFGMEVVGHDPHVDPWPEGVRPVELGELVATADVVSVHVHLSDATRGLLDRALLGRLKRGAILVNTSRGGIIDEAALLDGLRDGRIAAAGLDVLDGEPYVGEHPLVAYAAEHDNLVITPHIGGFVPDAVAAVCGRAAQKVRARLEGAGPACD